MACYWYRSVGRNISTDRTAALERTFTVITFHRICVLDTGLVRVLISPPGVILSNSSGTNENGVVN